MGPAGTSRKTGTTPIESEVLRTGTKEETTEIIHMETRGGVHRHQYNPKKKKETTPKVVKEEVVVKTTSRFGRSRKKVNYSLFDQEESEDSGDDAGSQ